MLKADVAASCPTRPSDVAGHLKGKDRLSDAMSSSHEDQFSRMQSTAYYRIKKVKTGRCGAVALELTSSDARICLCYYVGQGFRER